MGLVVYRALCLLGCCILGSSSTPVEVANHGQVNSMFSCPPGSFDFRNICYVYFNSPVPWHLAELQCQKLREDSHLASFSSLTEEKLVSAYIRSRSSATNGVWIGLNAVQDSNKLNWEWSDRSPYISGTPLWDHRSPSASLSSPECVTLSNIRSPSSSSRWSQVNCGNSYPYVCKFKA